MADKTTFFSVATVLPSLLKIPGNTPVTYANATVNPSPPAQTPVAAPTVTPPRIEQKPLTTFNARRPPGFPATVMMSPFPDGAKLTAPFNQPRVLNGQLGIHGGIDIVPATGNPSLYACCSGTVVWAYTQYSKGPPTIPDEGYSMIIQNSTPLVGKTWLIYYLHMAGPPTINGVKFANNGAQSSPITIGDYVGEYDNTGFSQGAHLHIIFNGPTAPVKVGGKDVPYADGVPIFANYGVIFS